MTPTELRALMTDPKIKRLVEIAISRGQMETERTIKEMALSRPSVVTVFFAKATTALTEKQSAYVFEKTHETDDTSFDNVPKMSDYNFEEDAQTGES